MSLELYKIALGQLKGIGPSRATRILGKLSSPSDLFTQSDRELHLQTGVSIAILTDMNRGEALLTAEKQLSFNERNHITSHFFMDEDYPRRLRQCSDAPIVLFSKGLTDLNQPNVVSVVGTRNQTEYGRKLVEELLGTIQSKDLTVISGLKPDRMNFPMRNRIIAGMSDAIIVVESKTKGGSIITAELGNDYNRDVFAFPGSVHQEQSEGCNWLIQKQKAHLIQNGNDFLTFMNWHMDMPQKQLELFPELEENELKVYQTLVELKEAHIDVIAMKSGLSTSQLNVLLFQLEMKNVVHAASGNRYTLQWKHCA